MTYRIWYHGTDGKSAKKILKSGYFKRWTFFAKHLEDAIGYGGLHIFEVAIKFDRLPMRWQALASNQISTNKIVAYKVFKKPEIKIYNEELKNKVAEANQGKLNL